MKFAGALVSLIFIDFILIFITVNSEETKTVYLPKQGRLVGNFDKTSKTNQPYMQFRGIPYANSPKYRRFKEPVAKYYWIGLHDATKYGRVCPVVPTEPKTDFWGHELEDLEDCLNLSVYTKALKKRLPVMFYLGSMNGSTTHKPPKDLMEKDIVLVVPQYRVGALGWLASLTNEMPGNAAIHDLFLALQWVQNFIRHFGGDKKQVTIFGHSVGADFVGLLVLTPIAPKRYFNRAIIPAGSSFPNFEITKKPVEQITRICNALGCKYCYYRIDIYHCLNQAKLKRLLEVTSKESFAPVVGDYRGLLPKHPTEIKKIYTQFWHICIHKLLQRVDKSGWNYENCYCASVC